LIYGVDVDGIFDANPKHNSDARLLSNLTPSGAARVVSKAEQQGAPDVTGGMAGKIREAIRAARHGIPVYFVNLMEDERLLKLALGQKVRSSRIAP
jgi:isopentenyl phosphate kinase